MGAPCIDIMLATYNGERYLGAQIDSIIAQTHHNWRLLVHDDGSTDSTRSILRDYADQFPGRIIIIEIPAERLGACQNFAWLLSCAEAEYIAFADQDDVWLPNKVEKLVTALKALEAVHGRGVPLLAHCAMEVVGPDLGRLHPSFHEFAKLDPLGGAKLNRMLVQNVVAGCAMMVNSNLARRALPIPPRAIMHDWWLALIAAARGHITFVDEPMVVYRQHGSNHSGTPDGRAAAMMEKVLDYVRHPGRKTGVQLARTRCQASALLERMKDCTDDDRVLMLRAYATLGERNYFSRVVTLMRHGFWQNGFLQRLAQILVA